MDDRAFMEAIYANWSAGTVRYSAPAIVRERCEYCGGSGLRAIGVGPLAKLENCADCRAKGYINREAA